MNKPSISIFALICILILSSCDEDNTESEKEAMPFGTPLEPDVVIGLDKFYLEKCSITQVSNFEGRAEVKIIFTVPSSALSVCKHSEHGEDPLQYDGQYLILTVCQMQFGAGACIKERYRSLDFANWQKYIGVTWRNGEEYEAWRELGSKSSKADFIKKVETNSRVKK